MLVIGLTSIERIYKMDIEDLKIARIPATLWGKKENTVWIAIHGNMSHKKDTVIEILANTAVKRKAQVLSFDLPKHGERCQEETQNHLFICIKELQSIMAYVKENYEHICLFGCSLGAYYALASYFQEKIARCLFLSPIVNMQEIIENMMTTFAISELQLQQQLEIMTPIGISLYWDYYKYVKDHPIAYWPCKTNILYGRQDDVCSLASLQSFVKMHQAKLTIDASGEHFYHTKKQLATFQNWLEKYM